MGVAMQLNLTSEIVHALEEQARRKGTTPEQLALAALREKFVIATPEETAPMEGSLADFLGDFVGSLQSDEHISGGAQMSENSGHKFAQGMIKKREMGHL
jgi:hypothetical protein